MRWLIATFIYFSNLVWSNVVEDIGHTYGPMNEEDMGDSDAVLDESHKLNGKFDRRLLINKTHPESCDQQMWLYTLTHLNTTAAPYNKTMSEDCSTRPFAVQRIVNSNLILLVIKTNCLQATPMQPPLMPDGEEIFYNLSLTCYRVKHDSYARRNYMSCINRNIHVSYLN